MCDYSLEVYRSRPAREGETYHSHRFPSQTVGFIAKEDPQTAVCMACDQRLALEGLPEALRDSCDVGASAEATFTRLETGAHRDAVRFANGAEVSLQQLGPGVTATLTDALDAPREARQRRGVRDLAGAW